MREKKKKMYLLAMAILLINTTSFGDTFSKDGEYTTPKSDSKNTSGPLHQISATNNEGSLIQLTNGYVTTNS